MKSISIVNHNVLDPKNNLYTHLTTAPPKWWSSLVHDPNLYIEIRKNNIVEVYYQGGTLAKLVYDKDTNQIIPIAHPKYIGHTDVNDIRYYKDNETHTPIYGDCSEWLDRKIENMKKNIRCWYTEKHKSIESVSEKKIQGELVVKNREKYLDSEFSHRLYEGERKEVRIDLVKIEDNQIVFEELKKINDSRLHTTKESGPEILKQMSDYEAFISKNQKPLLEYYSKLIKIKESLGLPLPKKKDSLVLNTKPVLIIANNYMKMTSERAKRIESIKQTLEKASIKYRIFDYNG